jgi:hypothetical protein
LNEAVLSRQGYGEGARNGVAASESRNGPFRGVSTSFSFVGAQQEKGHVLALEKRGLKLIGSC